MSSEPLLITGDFNIHVDKLGDPDGDSFRELLESMGFLQHVDKPTHQSGHTLDLIITRQCDSVLASVPITDYFLSDHCSILCYLKVDKTALSRKTISYRKIKDIDLQKLRDEVAETKLCMDCPNSLDDLVGLYNSTLAALLDKHAPMLSKTFNVRPLVPWFNNIKNARKERRKAEKKWRRTGSTSDFMEFKLKRNYTTHLMNNARREFFKEFIEKNSSNQKDLFMATNKLLKQDHDVLLPPFDNNVMLANQMGSFFLEKIKTIHTKLDKLTSTLADATSDDTELWSGVWLDHFKPISEDDVRKLIEGSSKKTCILDPMPTSLVINCIDVLLPVLTKIINLSLESGLFASNWKCALVKPLLKKPGLDLVFKNYRPVSNLQYVSKLTERVVFNQLHEHMMANGIYPVFQSAYRQHHSTETSLLRVMNDILLKMNSQHVTLLVLLDLSSAFDTVNHDVLLDRLHNDVGLRGSALNWFHSYLCQRSQQVSIHGTLSNIFDLDCGVPQGSCLGPLLFVVYASKLLKIIEKHLPNAHCFADDTQLYLSFKPDNMSSQNEAVGAMNRCIRDLRNWMIRDRLMINDDKTELLLIGTRQQLGKINDACNISVGDYDISPSSCVRNLGAWFDNKLSMSTHVTKICSAAFYHLHNIRRINKYLSRDSLLTLIHAFITSRLDYCNGLLYGLPKSQIVKLQRVQNAAARLVLKLGKYSHITPVLYELHWLPVQYRIHFKILILTFKAIHRLAPKYIIELIHIKPRSTYHLRSNRSLLLDPPKGKMLVTLGDRSFSAAAPCLWNSLPTELRDIQSLDAFKCKLKTYLFRIAFKAY